MASLYANSAPVKSLRAAAFVPRSTESLLESVTAGINAVSAAIDRNTAHNTPALIVISVLSHPQCLIGSQSQRHVARTIPLAAKDRAQRPPRIGIRSRRPQDFPRPLIDRTKKRRREDRYSQFHSA